MKKIWLWLFVAGVTILMATMSILHPNTQHKPTNTLYARIVLITDKEWNTYTGTDAQGNDWMFSNTNEWTIGDIIYLIMDTQGTEDITDDIIITESRAE